MKYEAKLEDGTLVVKSLEEGMEFCVNDGNFVKLGKNVDLSNIIEDLTLYLRLLNMFFHLIFLSMIGVR